MAEEVLQRTITQAPDYLQPGIEKFLELSTAQAAQPMDTSKFAPSVVGLGALQQQAQQQAATQAGLGTLQFDPTTGAVSGVTGQGVAGFEPFLQTAQQTMGGVQPFITAAAGRTGPTAYQAFESPYQTAVRDATLASFDEQAEARRQGIRDQAAAIGSLGAGRTGVQLAEYDRKSDMDRALLQAQLNQAGFTQANQLAAQAFGQQGQLAGLQSGLAQQQLGLAQLQPQLAAQNIGLLGQAGLTQQQQAQAALDTTAAGQQMIATAPQQTLGFFGGQLASLSGGYPQMTSTFSPVGSVSPMMQALGTIGSVGGAIGGITSLFT